MNIHDNENEQDYEELDENEEFDGDEKYLIGYGEMLILALALCIALWATSVI